MLEQIALAKLAKCPHACAGVLILLIVAWANSLARGSFISNNNNNNNSNNNNNNDNNSNNNNNNSNKE